MTWYGQNRSGREEPWAIGSIVRYDDGPTALMRITSIHPRGDDGRGIATSIRYYGEQFFGGAEGRYHGQCSEPSAGDLAVWEKCHDGSHKWIPGMYAGTIDPKPEQRVNRPAMKRIPITAAKEIANRYGYDQVIIYARRCHDSPEPQGEHLTSYGRTKAHCGAAAKIADYLKKVMRWNITTADYLKEADIAA